MILTLFMLLILAACIGFLYQEGLWGNTIRLVNVVTAALLATNFFEPAADFLSQQMPRYKTFFDFISVWGLFVLFLVLMRLVTDFASRVKVHFLPVVDRIGSPLAAAWVGWVMICFTLMTLHTAPLPREFLMGGFRPENRMFLGLAPDRLWLGFVQRMSMGAYSQGPGKNNPDQYVFDPEGLFMAKYATRRATPESKPK